jgi:phage/plasmid-like protein (TIGR03299 family)
MSQETATWLNTMTLIGNTAKRGHAWHYRAEEQGDESNHYEFSIPVDDVKRRLFGWQAEPRRVAVEFPATFETMTHLGDDGQPLRWVVQTREQAIAANDTYDQAEPDVLGQFKTGYKIHDYGQWLVDNVGTILDDDLAISSAGLLRNRAQAWVEVSVPDTIKTPEGVEFRPNLLAATSLDGSIATTYSRTVQLTVCDNTMAVALSERGQKIKVRHSSQSLNRVGDVREALKIVHTAAAEFTAQVAHLVATPVQPHQFERLVQVIFPIKADAGKRSVTMAEDKRAQLFQLYRYDERVAPWSGTAFGAVQAFNTWRHHVQNGLPGDTEEQKRVARALRNAGRAVTGENETSDLQVTAALATILA